MKTAFLSLLLVAGALCSPVAASPLSDLTSQHGLDWMLGKWVSADGNVKVAYEWKLDKAAIGLTFSMGDRKAEGFMVLRPGTETVEYGAVDSTGAVTRGQWVESPGGNPALKATRTATEGEMKTYAEHVKVDDDTMKVKVFRQNDSGGAGELLVEVEFKKEK